MKSPPFSAEARAEAGYLLRLQEGERLSLPESRPMPRIGANCHELRVVDENVAWRIVYALMTDAVVILGVFQKKTRATPKQLMDEARKRLKRYLKESEED